EWDTKNQHRVWWNEEASGGGRWDAILPAAAGVGNTGAPASQWRIVRGVDSPAASDYVAMVDAGGRQRPDVFWDEVNDDLYILMSGQANNTMLYVYSYNSTSDTYQEVRSESVPLSAPTARAS